MSPSVARRASALIVAWACGFGATIPAPTVFAAEPAAQATTQPAAGPTEDADQLFQQGIDARKAGKLAEAEALLSKAWALKKTWDIAANLGLVELKLGKLAEGEDHVYYAITDLPPTESDATRDSLVKAFESVRSQLGGVDVRSDVDGAEVRINGKLKGTTPLRRTQFVLPGQVTIEVTKDGYVPATKVIDVGKASNNEVELALVKQAPAGRSYVAPAIAFGVGGVGLVVGAITAGVSLAQYNDVRKSCSSDGVCPTRLSDEADTGKTLGHVATAGFVVAGIGAAVGATLLVVPVIRSAPARAGLTFGPSFVGVKGSF